MTETLQNVITKIKDYKIPEDVTSLSVWDIDDTLYNTPTKVKIVNPDTGKILAVLSTAEYANFHSMGLNKIKRKYNTDKFLVDFSQFSDSKFFQQNAKQTKHFPTALREFADRKNFFIILTARNNMVDPNVFLSRFENDGLRLKSEPKRSHLIRLASLGNKYGDKGSVLNEILMSVKSINEVKYWDDSVTEVGAVTRIKNNFPKVKFQITRIVPTINRND